MRGLAAHDSANPRIRHSKKISRGHEKAGKVRRARLAACAIKSVHADPRSSRHMNTDPVIRHATGISRGLEQAMEVHHAGPAAWALP